MNGPVILVTIDTLRADRFTEGCFPESMDIIKSDFANFKNAYSHGNATPLAFPGIIAGHPAIGDGKFPDRVPTIASLFSHSSGFSNNGYLSEYRGYNRGFGLFHDQHPPDYDPDSDKGLSKAITERVLDVFRSFDQIRESGLAKRGYRSLNRVGSIIKGGDIFELEMPAWSGEDVTEFILRRVRAGDEFVWGHYMDAHKPFIPMEGVDAPSTNRSPEEIRELNSYDHEKDPLSGQDMDLLERLYESNIRYCDKKICDLIEELKEMGCYDEALIIITGDHGELFGEHGYMFHPMDIDPVDELIEVPLVVKYPDEHNGEQIDYPVQHRDIIKTIQDTIDGNSETIADNTYHLNNSTSRTIISKSNTAIRVTEADGTGIRRRDGTVEYSGKISKTGKEVLKSASFPAVKTSSGEVKGVEELERQEQLEALGYR